MTDGDLVLAQVLPVVGATVLMLAGAVFAAMRWAVKKIMTDFEARVAALDEAQHAIQRIMTELPLLYQRRDDAIREYVAMNAKLDRIWEGLLETRRER